MRLARLFSFVLIFSAILAGCQALSNQNNSGQTPAESTALSSNTGAYPQPTTVATVEAESIPYPPQETQPLVVEPETGSVYPELSDGDEVDWSKAVSIILSGQVSQVVQTHDLKVYITLKDGRTVVSTEPVIDELFQLIEYCGEPCSDIRVATE